MGRCFTDRKMIDIKELMKFKGSLNTENIMEGKKNGDNYWTERNR